MKILRHIVLLLCLSIAPMAMAREQIADVLHDKALNMKRPADREKAVARMKIIEDRRLKNAQARGRALGIPLEENLPNGGWRKLVDFDAEGPVYIASRNLNAAISTGANLTWTAPYNLNGAGLIVGVWDSGMGRPTHREFATGSRLVSISGGSMSYHSMHIAGTIGALGVNPNARGMANAAKIHSYDTSYVYSDMTAVCATSTGQTATKIHTSNHSYGSSDGWESGTWLGTGTDQNAYDVNFGQYGEVSNGIDAVMYNTPYHASFWASGNDRLDNPTNGQTVTIGGISVIYNSAIHPQGDAFYRGGYETISFASNGKNTIAIGAVNDAVTSGMRDIAKATLSNFSSTGPADDGRIKPDLVANGVNITSTDKDSDSDYATFSGTSFASPNACGSATLLVDQYNRLLSSTMRASTLKALLIHTADDLGNPGPDYFYGWGLINVKKGADLIASHAAVPESHQITESNVSTTTTSREYSFVSDGSSPIAATIAWTDPAASAVYSHDSRTPVLVNNLNLKIIAPNGAEYFPYIMPFVGTWTVASMSQNATTGVNNVDNVEQVRIAAPGQAGIWRAVVSYTGTITNTTQDFGLIISGLSPDKILELDLNASSVSEAAGNGATTGTVRRTGTSGDVIVSLTSENTSKITVPASVTIADGQTTSLPFPVNAVDNLVLESTQPVTITATASGYLTSNAVIDVMDNDNRAPVVDAGPDRTVFLNGAPSILDWTYSAWTGDANSGISDQYTYTAKHSFGNNRTSVTVNNVTFTESFNTSGTGWSVGGFVANGEGDDPNNMTGISEDLAEEYISNEYGKPRTVTFSGLTVGQAYEVTFYSVGCDYDVWRWQQTFSGTSQAPLVVSQNYYSNNNGIKISCIYLATGTSQTFTINSTVFGFNLYAMTNRVVNLSTATANFDGTVSDADGHTPATTWTLINGPAGATLGNAALVDTTATFNFAGAYTFRLTANDGFSQVSDDVVIHVNLAGSGYSMAYAGNGSTGGSVPVDGTRYTLNAPVTVLGNTGTLTRAGYTFNNWNTAANGTGTSYAPAATFSIDTNTTLYAQWTAIPTYTVSYDGNGSTGGSIANQIKSQDVDITLSGVGALVRPGYAFSNWNTQANGLGTSYAAGAPYSVNAALTLYAQWTLLPTYTVSFDSNGSTGGTTPSNQTKIHNDNLVLSGAGNLIKTGHSFAGWNTAQDGSGTHYAAGANYSTNASIILYAKWNALPTVDAGPNQTVAIGDIALWTPAEISTITSAWYDAADSASVVRTGTAVSQWNDKSGKGRNAAQGTSNRQPSYLVSDPMVNNKPSIGNITASGSIGLITPSMAAKHVYVVSYYKDGIDASFDGYATLFSGAGTYGLYRVMGNINTANFIDTSNFNNNGTFANGATASSLTVLPMGASVFKFKSTDSRTQVYSLGFNSTDNTRDWQGYYSEWIFTDGTEDTATEQKIEGYLAHKWGLAANLPDHHPYKELAPGIPVATANLNGIVSDAENDNVTTTWEKVSGPPAAVTFANASARNTTASFTANGTYTLRLTASDGVGLSSDDCVITVASTPTVTAWPTAAAITEGNALSSATLSGGTASVDGAFSYDSPSVIPAAGTYSAAVTFTPTDTTNYRSVSGSVDVTVQTAFEGWVTDGGGGGVTFEGDANGDGVADGMAWLLGVTSPQVNARSLTPSPAVNRGDLSVNFDCLKTDKRGSAVLSLQYSTSLAAGSWTSTEVPATSGPVNGVNFTITPIPGTDLVDVQATIPASVAGEGGKIFARLAGTISGY